MADKDLWPKPEVSTVKLEHNGMAGHAVQLRVSSRTTILTPNMVMNLIAELATVNLTAQKLTHEELVRRAKDETE